MKVAHRRRVRHTLSALAAVGAAVVLGAGPAAAAEAEQRLIVGFAPSESSSEQASALRASGVAVTATEIRQDDVPALDAAFVDVPGSDVASVRRALLRRSDVEYVEIDRMAHAAWSPNDLQLADQWALAKVGATTAWDTNRGAGVKIAVVDTGVSYIHPDLQGKVELGWDYVGNDADPMDEQGHGTHVAGIVAGIADNANGIAGLAPDATILAMRALDQNGSGYYSWIASAITSSVDKGAKVVNLSLGGAEGSKLLEEAVGYAAAHGALVVCATGNEGASVVGFPARYGDCLAVGASDENDLRATFSNQGEGIDLVAPGTSILSSVPGGYDRYDGTSMATPYAAGLAGLLYSQGLSRAQVVATMTGTAADLGAPGYDTEFGAGRIDAARAVATAAGTPPPSGDVTKPTVAGITVGTPVQTGTVKYSKAWKKTKTTRWKLVGRTDRSGSYTWQTIKKRPTAKTITQFKIQRRKVYRRTVAWRVVKVAGRSGNAQIPVTISASDDVGVDRVGLSVDGHWLGTDWNGADGWSLTIPCSPGEHTFAVRAFDARDNAATYEAKRTITC